MTVAEKTLATLHERLAELRSELDVETDAGRVAHIEREIAGCQRRIEQVHTWAETPMGLKDVV